MKIPPRLLPLLEEGLIVEVIRPLMSGKEAAVYVVRDKKDVMVAKVYKEAERRSFRQRAAYTEGRQVRNSRSRRAMERGSKFGREQEEAAWQSAEVDALYRLAAAGVRVPKALHFYEGVLLMEVVLNPEGWPAPRLVDCDFSPREAWAVHELLMHQVVLMLCAGIIHGDLSEYNVLMAWDGPMIIDLPQAINAAHNQSARELLIRDVTNITNFLARFDPEIAETRYGQEMWGLYERAKLFTDTPLTGRWRDSTRRANTHAVLDEIAAAEFEVKQRRGR
ncbi:MAG: serine protein kinase RIO [Deltaproteobacteria bacterium]|nr:serine protein kinase RIO [Deltaproteobacteria bacterium]